MAFDTRKGTRGARQPRGRALIWFNRLIMRRIRGGARFRRRQMLVLTTVGRKSGVPRQTPVTWFAGDGGGWIVVASAGGAAANPAWFLNLAARPEADVEVAGRTVPVVAEHLHGEERARVWERIVREAPRFGGYQRKTDRELPVVLLTERRGQPG
ncbi:nitroreductase/quinone reductase family protein [Symbioplanes lichenis]|uniref:nitroreductase/quinone reductase family protein n=1 Tax=Symbioplanes lichenis TaxID=1629072 RepID=UPI002738B451|nr:nitroreductase/quinone reductase family protein [Actinoplanes lichenis]